MTNSIGEIRDVDCLLVTGSNTAESHPVLSYEMIRAVKKGASLIILDPRRIPLVSHAHLHLQATPGTDIYVFLAMMHVILREGLSDERFIEARVEGFEELAASVESWTPEAAALRSGVPAELIEKAARMYALGERQRGVSKYGDGRGHSGIYYAMGITQRSSGTDIVKTLANLAMLCGQIGKPSSGVNPLRGQSNVQGACDLGCLPGNLPGYLRTNEAAHRQQVAEGWGVEGLPETVGLTIVEMMHAASAGDLRALYVMGENPMISDPNLAHVEEALRSLDLLIVQDIFLNETAALAHIVLPASCALEKVGTMTNTERRVQLLSPVVEAPGEALPDWQILCALGKAIDAKLDNGRAADFWEYASSTEIMDEIARVTPIYAGVSYDRLPGAGLAWPVKDKQHPGTQVLHQGQFSSGKGRMFAIEPRDPAELPDEEYPLILTTGRSLYQYHSGTMTRRSEGLAWRAPRSYAEINTRDAEKYGIRDAGQVMIHSRRGMVRTQAQVGDKVPEGVVFLPFHWRETPTNLLIQDHTLDPAAKIPEFKITAVRLEGPKGKR